MNPLVRAFRGTAEISGDDHIEFLKNLGQEAGQAVAVMADALNDHATEIRVAAAAALGWIRPTNERAIAELVRAIKDREIEVRRAAYESLCQIGLQARASVPHLILALRRGGEELDRSYAASALGRIDPTDHATVAALVEAAEDAEINVRVCVAGALGHPDHPFAQTVVPVLIRLLRDASERVRQSAARSLGYIGPAAQYAVAALVEALADEDSYVRAYAAESLGWIGPAAKQAWKPVWILRHTDKEPHVRVAAAYAQGVLDAFSRGWSENNQNRLRLAAIEADALNRLSQLKLFYVVMRAYMEGGNSLRGTREALLNHHFHNLANDDLPTSVQSFSVTFDKLMDFFPVVMKKPDFQIVSKPKGLPARFTDDAQAAWLWTDKFLRRHLAPDWFGFSRLLPQGE